MLRYREFRGGQRKEVGAMDIGEGNRSEDGYNFWKAATWSVPFTLALGIAITFFTVAVAGFDDGDDGTVSACGAVVAIVMSVAAAVLWRAGSSAKKGIAIGTAAGAVVLCACAVAFDVSYR